MGFSAAEKHGFHTTWANNAILSWWEGKLDLGSTIVHALRHLKTSTSKFSRFRIPHKKLSFGSWSIKWKDFKSERKVNAFVFLSSNSVNSLVSLLNSCEQNFKAVTLKVSSFLTLLLDVDPIQTAPGHGGFGSKNENDSVIFEPHWSSFDTVFSSWAKCCVSSNIHRKMIHYMFSKCLTTLEDKTKGKGPAVCLSRSPSSVGVRTRKQERLKNRHIHIYFSCAQLTDIADWGFTELFLCDYCRSITFSTWPESSPIYSEADRQHISYLLRIQTLFLSARSCSRQRNYLPGKRSLRAPLTVTCM